ncbi:M56 family metallopeptidase [Pseudoclostridium thermosuccinogenes]|uniref:M56 family metallopeptidase n=1 Tax=Clostridium thermosuccinogenes TaxID=84032 RepID=UPI002FD8BE4F
MELLKSVFLSVLNMSVTASLVAVAVIIARLPLKKSPKVFSYALWSAVLFRLVCPFSFSSRLSLLGFMPSSQAGSAPARYIPEDTGMIKLPLVDIAFKRINAAFSSSIPPAAAPLSKLNPMDILIFLGALIWLTGMAVMLVYAAIAYLRLKRRISTATLVSENIYESDLIRSPFVFGFVKPKIYLPLSLTGEEREYILLHEKTHIQRLDYIVKLVAFLVLALHWFNPIMWLCFSLMTRDMEMSCDERVIQKTSGLKVTSYSRSLLALASQKKMPAPGPLAFGESNVKARIKNLLDYKKPAFWLIIASIAIVAVLTVMLVSNPVSGINILEHPESFLGEKILRSTSKVRIVDNATGDEYILTDANKIGQVTAIIEKMRISKKEIRRSRSQEHDSRYSIFLYYDTDDANEEYNCVVHIDPVWVDNNVKPSLKFNLVNRKETLSRLEDLIADIIRRTSYDVKFLMENKTQYVGNHVKVGSLLNGMPLPEGVTRGILELLTSEPPYGVIYHYELTDDTIEVGEEQFLRNSVLLFALIDNVDEITHLGHWSNKSLSSTPFKYTYTRADIEKIVGGDVRQFAVSEEKLKELIEIVQMMVFDSP